MMHAHHGPNGRVEQHNHQHGEVSHSHGALRPMDRWTWHPPVGAPVDGHLPLSVLNHAATGIRTMVICSCEQMKANPSARMSTMDNGHMAHRRHLGLPRADYSQTRFGEGPWKGLTWDEWYAAHGSEGLDPYTGEPRS